MQELIQAIQSELQLSEDALKEANAAAARVQTIEANIVRLKAALTALSAPQTPDGRKRIGAARRKSKAAATPAGEGSVVGSTITTIAECARPILGPHKLADAVAAAPVCSECKLQTPTVACRFDGCDANICQVCMAPHYDRWHSEGGAA